MTGIGTGTARLSPMTESLHCSPEIITILLIGYIPIQKKKFKKKDLDFPGGLLVKISYVHSRGHRFSLLSGN